MGDCCNHQEKQKLRDSEVEVEQPSIAKKPIINTGSKYRLVKDKRDEDKKASADSQDKKDDLKQVMAEVQEKQEKIE